MNNTYLGIIFFIVLLLLYLYKTKYVNVLQEPFIQVEKLSNSEMLLEKNPEYLLPSNNTITDPSSNDGEDLYKDKKINTYITIDGNIIFKKSEVEQVFKDQLKTTLLGNQQEKTDDSMIARFMVPLLWQITKNQFNEFSNLASEIQTLERDLHSANKQLINVNEVVREIGEDSIDQKRKNDFDFKNF